MAGTVDVTTTLREFEDVLKLGADRDRCFDLLAVLWRWQHDPDLNEDSRRRARELIQVYGKHYVGAGA
jgi:hypothetical protein